MAQIMRHESTDKRSPERGPGSRCTISPTAHLSRLLPGPCPGRDLLTVCLYYNLAVAGYCNFTKNNHPCVNMSGKQQDGGGGRRHA